MEYPAGLTCPKYTDYAKKVEVYLIFLLSHFGDEASTSTRLEFPSEDGKRMNIRSLAFLSLRDIVESEEMRLTE